MKTLRTLIDSLALASLALASPTLLSAQTTVRMETPTITWLFPIEKFDNTQPFTVQPHGNGGYELSGLYKTDDGTTINLNINPNYNDTKLKFDNTIIEENVIDINFDRITPPVEASAEQFLKHSVTLEDNVLTIAPLDSTQVEMTYRLTGSFAGSVVIQGNYKARVELNGVNINATGNLPALWIDNGKRIDVVVGNGTINTLSDAATNIKKAAFFVKGHVEMKGGGFLNITGNARHAYASNEYTWIRQGFGSLEINGAGSDGMHIGQYLKVDDGTININGTQGDAIDVEYTFTDVAETIIDPNDEYNGEVIINGGTINARLQTINTKAISSHGNMTINGGTINITLDADGTRGLAVGSKSKTYYSDLIVNETDPLYNPTTINFSGTGGNSNDEKIRAIRVAGNASQKGGKIEILLTGTNKPIKIDGFGITEGGTSTHMFEDYAGK